MKTLQRLAIVLGLFLGAIGAAKAVTYTFAGAVWPAWVIDFTNGVIAYTGSYVQFGIATGVPAHIGSAQTTAPGLGPCGTSPSIVGTDTAGEVTMGTTATGCVITFNVAYNTAPFCTVTWQATPLASQSYTVTTTAITTVQTSTTNNKLNYLCVARAGG